MRSFTLSPSRFPAADDRSPLILAAALGTAAGVGLLAGTEPRLLVAAVLLAVSITLLIGSPSRLLLSFAVLIFLFIPWAYVDQIPGLLVVVSPSAVIAVAWLLRERPTVRTGYKAPLALLLGALAVWTSFASLSGADPESSVRWLVPFVVLGLLPIAAAFRRPAGALAARTTFIWGATTLSGFAVIETFVLQANPLFGGLFADSAFGPVRQFEVWDTYRATTTLGHPLLNSAVFAVAGSFALGDALRGKGNWYYVAAALTAVGVVATASRTGLAAVLAGFTAALLMSLWSRSSRFRAMRAAVGLVAMSAILGSAIFSGVVARQDSREGRSSAESRQVYAQEGASLAMADPVNGVGPGGALVTATQGKTSATNGNFENSIIDFTLATGFVGVALLVLLYLGLGASAVRASDAGAVGALVAYVVSQLGFNLLQAYPLALLILGLVGANCVAHARR